MRLNVPWPAFHDATGHMIVSVCGIVHPAGFQPVDVLPLSVPFGFHDLAPCLPKRKISANIDNGIAAENIIIHTWLFTVTAPRIPIADPREDAFSILLIRSRYLCFCLCVSFAIGYLPLRSLSGCQFAPNP